MGDTIAKLLKIFQDVKGLTPNFLNKLLTLPIDLLIEILIEQSKLPVSKEDLEQVELTKQEARRLIKRGKHHTFCLIRDQTGKFHRGLQRTYHRHGAEDTCAEEGAISDLSCDQAVAVTVSTVHFMPIPERGEGEGVTSIVAPCYDCANRLRIVEIEQGETIGVIVYHRDQIIKVPAHLAVLFNYPVKHDHET